MPIKKIPSRRKAFGTKPEPLAIKAICEGIVAGFLSDHFLGRREAAYEAALRPHILSTAYMRGFGAFLEFPVNLKKGGRGSKKKLDAVLFYGSQLLGIELKTIRKDTGRLHLENDFEKLKNFLQETISDDPHRRVTGWQIIVWSDQSFDTHGFKDIGKNGMKEIDAEIMKLNNKKIGNVSSIKKLRTPFSGQKITVQGTIGNFSAWALAICICCNKN